MGSSFLRCRENFQLYGLDVVHETKISHSWLVGWLNGWWLIGWLVGLLVGIYLRVLFLTLLGFDSTQGHIKLIKFDFHFQLFRDVHLSLYLMPLLWVWHGTAHGKDHKVKILGVLPWLPSNTSLDNWAVLFI